ncbi:hypothetical protein MD484_g1579, partial [Candolleomyces efflorescens]
MLIRISLYLSLLTLFISSALSGPTGLRKRVDIQRYTGDGETSGRHLVLLKPGASREGVISQLANTVDVVYQWGTVCNGFAAVLDSVSLQLLQSLPEVESIEEDGIMRTMGTVTQSDAPWGLARLSSKTKLADQDASQLNFSYIYDSSAGSGVDIYIIDTGVNIEHNDFGGRARKTDDNGHGTHVAATAGGTQFGVAKAATIYAIKVLNAAGYVDIHNDSGILSNAHSIDRIGATSDIIAAMDYVAGVFKEFKRPTVVNMSLGGGASNTMDTATRNLVTAGVHVAVAAGNDNVDAKDTSPARVKEAITAGASDITDSMASFSNFGEVVDVFAPGKDIISASHLPTLKPSKSLSGTSMASPHIAGLIAYLIGLEGNQSPADMQSKLKKWALKGNLTGVPPGTANLLAHNKQG